MEMHLKTLIDTTLVGEPHNCLDFDTIHPLKMPGENLQKSLISFNFLTMKFHVFFLLSDCLEFCCSPHLRSKK